MWPLLFNKLATKYYKPYCGKSGTEGRDAGFMSDSRLLLHALQNNLKKIKPLNLSSYASVVRGPMAG